ncbi:hypothetical protein SPHINGO391_500085 [Sphingomonas aurantiaca]|uniref:Uncharacterized protein n=1 Tax=Sphingomonas aurantiaca TaxID=185949 RepID=A0A5E8A9L1_9SPHN|nr:hypothetical protein SPHINGO391_500085 [Sphingomonas aurantiaca]
MFMPAGHAIDPLKGHETHAVQADNACPKFPKPLLSVDDFNEGGFVRPLNGACVLFGVSTEIRADL